nr:MAG TPA: hypothetical protein [Caudoviricetes sp.]
MQTIIHIHNKLCVLSLSYYKYYYVLKPSTEYRHYRAY